MHVPGPLTSKISGLLKNNTTDATMNEYTVVNTDVKYDCPTFLARGTLRYVTLDRECCVSQLLLLVVSISFICISASLTWSKDRVSPDEYIQVL